MEGLVRRDPDYVDALQLLGDHYTQRGRYAEGLKVDEHLSCLEPHDPLVFYNLACSYSLTDQFDRAGHRHCDDDLHRLSEQGAAKDFVGFELVEGHGDLEVRS